MSQSLEPVETPLATAARPVPIRQRSVRAWVLLGFAVAMAIGAVVPAGAYFLAKWSWLCDALTHFEGPSVIFAALAACAFAGLRRRWLAAALLVVALWQGSGLFRFVGEAPVLVASGGVKPLRILMANVLHPNENYDDLAALIRREQPDVVGLVEISEDWIVGLDRTGVRSEFPYRVELPLGGQGLALWFRERPYRLEPPQVFSSPGNPVFKATIALGDGLTTLWLVHPPNPIGAGRTRSNPDLEALAEQSELRGGSQIVVGDLNRTECSPYFHDFLRQTRLNDTRTGFGRQPTWPTWSPYRIALDHAFVSPDLAVISRRVGADIGSDHLPLIIDVVPASATTNSRN